MSRKDYQLIADALKYTKPANTPSLELAQWQKDVDSIALALSRDNERFDRERFSKAAGLH